MKIEPLIALAEATGHSLEWLATGRGPMRPGQEVLPPVSHGGAAVPPGYVLIPRYEARASAGPGVIAPSARVIDSMVMSEEYVRRVLRRRPDDLVLLECLGDSMDPTLRDGDAIMIDWTVREVRASRLYVLEVNEDLFVKRLQVRLDGSVRVISDNPRYEPEDIMPSARNALRIVGEVVWAGGPVRG